MKILTVADFDPAGVLRGHRRSLRALGVDYRLAVVRTYWREGEDADWWLDGGCADLDVLRDFAEDADIIQFNPVITQPWSSDPAAGVNIHGGRRVPYGSINWTAPEFERSRKVDLFHGSINLWNHAEEYRAEYASRGAALFTTSPRYALRLGIPWMPPCVHMDLPRAAPASEPLTVAHASTDPRLNWTRGLAQLCNRLGVVMNIITGLDHAECLHRKRWHPVAFSHLDRGVPSVSTVEDAALGMVPLVGTTAQHRMFIEAELGCPWTLPVIETPDDLERWLDHARRDFAGVAEQQDIARAWYDDAWHPDRIGPRLLAAYRAL